MTSSLEPCYLLSHTLVFFLCFGFITVNVNTSSDYNLIYKKCINQTFINPNGPLLSEFLSSLFQELIPQSSQSKFFETSVGDETAAIYGFFQCREDLSNGDCYNCVSKVAQMSNSLCGETIPTRVQLSGCYIHYEADGSEASGVELLHKTCSESKAVVSSGFADVRDGAFAGLEKGVIAADNGFVDMEYKSLMHVMAQCEGNLGGGCDCGDCVSAAVRIAEDECGYSLSGQVYLHNCFITYTYNANSFPENGTGSNSGKLVAIGVGGLAVLLFGLAILYFIRKQKSDDW
ncbi:hypothetical protein F0562_032209 [Nyssa sinensis]|uniref:Gnk2-homologous domain-containing protein n=1 Tax=Nyssa sinensis TaxID=561372 RepID=A0A5J5AY39_9ASTE|nr:hypothetical protein F0562_032209 [Nyssa sinensis]